MPVALYFNDKEDGNEEGGSLEVFEFASVKEAEEFAVRVAELKEEFKEVNEYDTFHQRANKIEGFEEWGRNVDAFKNRFTTPRIPKDVRARVAWVAHWLSIHRDG